MALKTITVITPSVFTEDVLAGYNFYSDQDGKLNVSVIDTTTANSGYETELSDGLAHSVTAKPVGVATGEYNAPSDAVNVDLTYDYYVSATGTGDGLSASTPMSFASFQTLTSTIPDNKTVAFNGGDRFEGSFSLSGKNGITLTSYGTGKAEITGSEILSTFELSYGSVYRSTQFKTNIYGVEGDVLQGRFPKLQDDYSTNTYGYFNNYARIDSYTNKYSFQSDDLIGVTSLVGATIHVLAAEWRFRTSTILTHDTGTGAITVDTYQDDANVETISVGDHFWVTNLKALCQTEGEWFHDAVGGDRLFIYASSMPSNVKVRTNAGSGITITNSDNITIENLKINQFQTAGISADASDYLTVDNCEISDCYFNGIVTDNVCYQPTVTNCVFNDISQYAIVFDSFLLTNTDLIYGTVENNTFNRIGLLNKITEVNLGSNFTVFPNGEGCEIRYNTFNQIGLNGIKMLSNSSIVEDNYFKHACLNFHDGAAIYWGNKAWDFLGADNSICRNNIIEGTGNYPSTWTGNGIYLDDRTKDSEVYNNTISGAYYGIYFHNTRNMNVHHNNVFDCVFNEVYFASDSNGGSGAHMYGNLVNNNNLCSLRNNSSELMRVRAVFTEATDPVYNFATWDFNKYVTATGIKPININYTDVTATDYTLAEWQTYSSEDANSTNPIATEIHLASNPTNVASNESLPAGTWYELDGTSHTGTISIPAYGGVILIKS